MGLNAAVFRDGEPLAVHWGLFHTACMALASTLDSGIGPEPNCSPVAMLGRELALLVRADRNTPIMVTPELIRKYVSYTKSPMGKGVYRLKRTWTFQDPDDGEIFPLLAGDELHMYG